MPSANQSCVFVCTPNAVSVAQMQLDPFEMSVLEISRIYFETFQSPEKQLWAEAFHLAEQRFDVPYGATVAQAVATILLHLQSKRAGIFAYFGRDHAEAYTLLTQDEANLMRLVQHMRAGRVSLLHSTALILACGGNVRPLLATVEQLCILSGDVDKPRFQN